MMKKTYENALKLLNSRRRVSRPTEPFTDKKVLQDVTPKASSSGSDLKGTPSIVGMKEWLSILGYTDSDINRLNIIHIAGTKGKGSTCAYTRSLLLAHSQRTSRPLKVGLYTSPDLRSLLERIQINNSPISPPLFTQYFFEVWDALEASSYARKPRFLQLMALTAIHTFVKEKTDVAIFECHHGGEYDATNVFEKPVVAVVTTVGCDHMAQLGPGVRDVAWHKSGIFKEGCAAVAAPQEEEEGVREVLEDRARERGAELGFVSVDETLPISVPVQRLNCSVAVRVVEEYFKGTGPEGADLTRDDVLEGIKGFTWPGRFETIQEGKCTWYLDGAHNELSLKEAAEWFAKSTEDRTKEDAPHILIFTHISTEREAASLLDALAKGLAQVNRKPQHVIFTTFQERADGNLRLGTTPKAGEKIPVSELLPVFTEVWRKTDKDAGISAAQSIEEAVQRAREIGGEKGMKTLVTGSLHLVGGALNVLSPME